MDRRHMYHEYRENQMTEDDSQRENASSSIASDSTRTHSVDDGIAEFEEEILIEGSDLARAHWIQLQKVNKQGIVIQHCFLHMLNKYKQTRPIWQFGRNIHDDDPKWKHKIADDFYFRHHCASVQAAICMIMENKDDPTTFSRIVSEMGAHHFFYDAIEPHLEIFEDSLIHALNAVPTGTEALDEDTEKSWRIFLTDVKQKMGEGIAIQRTLYLKQCVTEREVDEAKQVWSAIQQFGIDECGQTLCRTAVQEYMEQMTKLGLAMPFPLEDENDVFVQFAHFTMVALGITIDSFEPGEGFTCLPIHLQEYTVICMILEVCPSLIRKALIKGMREMLYAVLGKEGVSETTMHTWTKLYRVLEQAIITNIIEY